jgi:hypothetical protein
MNSMLLPVETTLWNAGRGRAIDETSTTGIFKPLFVLPITDTVVPNASGDQVAAWSNLYQRTKIIRGKQTLYLLY